MAKLSAFDEFRYLMYAVFLGDETGVEDVLMLVGTVVASLALVLWWCFPVDPNEGITSLFLGRSKPLPPPPRQYDARLALYMHRHSHQSWWGGRRSKTIGFHQYVPLPTPSRGAAP